MAEVHLMIDGRMYDVACDDGQEKRVQQLGSYVDQRMKEVSGAGSVNKAQNMVLASLLLADEVFDLNERMERSVKAHEELSKEETHISYQGLNPQDEQGVTTALGKMASKIEYLTARARGAA
ncbi:MAG: cell division protein ZapA [Pseudobdellovibrionaceae bacterium]